MAIHCIVVTPAATSLDTQADSVALPLFDGEIGIYSKHSPMIGRLGFGEMRIESGGSTQHYYVDGGFVQVNDDVVTVLTNRANLASDVDQEAAQAQLDDAMKRPIDTPELLQVRERLIAQARAQLRVASRN